MNEPTNKRMNERTNENENERMNERTKERINQWMTDWLTECIEFNWNEMKCNETKWKNDMNWMNETKNEINEWKK
jgi:hypothetical protein